MSILQGEIVGALLALALFTYTFWPENAFASQGQKTRLDYLLERQQQRNENLRDLRFEHSLGKYAEEDFAAQQTRLQEEEAELQAEIERLQSA